jgi:hypothetical protein
MAAQHKRPGRNARIERQQRAAARARAKAEAKAKRDRCVVLELWPVVRDHRPGRVVAAAEWRELA